MEVGRFHRVLRIALVVALVGAVAAPLTAGALSVPKTLKLVSYGPGGTYTESYCSHVPDVSSDGRYVSFETDNSLVTEDTDAGITDVFRRDTVTGETRIASAPGDSAWGSGARDARISDDGRFVSFFTRYAFDTNDTNGGVDIYVWDAADDSRKWVDLHGISATNGEDLNYEMSGDGSTIVIETYDSLDVSDTFSSADVYAIDVSSGAITWVSGGAIASSSYGSREPSVSDDGRFVAFVSGKVFTADDTNGGGSQNAVDVYIRDLDASEPTFALVPLRDYMTGPGYAINELEISGDGSLIAFESSGSYASGGFSVPDDTLSSKDIYAYDTDTETFWWVSGYPLINNDLGSREPEVSNDGTLIAFYTGKSFTAEDTDGEPEVYLFNTASSEYTLLNARNSLQYDSADRFSLSGDGNSLVWESGSDLVPEDYNGACDIYTFGLPVPADDDFWMDEDTTIADSVAINDGLFGAVGPSKPQPKSYEPAISVTSYSVALVDDVKSGALTLYANGVFVYTPDADFNGFDTFTYSVTDLSGEWPGVGTVTINVGPVNDAPVALGESFSTPMNVTLNGPVSVLANDTDVDGDILAAVLQTDVSHGTLNLSSEGIFTYAPAAGFSGTDSFTYKVNDGTANSSVATVSISVYKAASPVYRFFNVKTGTHFYTTSASEKAAVETKLSSMYKYEGIAYYVYEGLDGVPLYRFYNRVNGAHLYTADEQEKAMIQQLWGKTFGYEGVAYKVSRSSGPGMVPIFRFVNMRNAAHFYTSSAAERDAVMTNLSTIYHYEGVAFFVSAP